MWTDSLLSIQDNIATSNILTKSEKKVEKTFTASIFQDSFGLSQRVFVVRRY
jgi:hypothetical protein